ncbi:hypothetical protein IBL25_26415, partial [Roseomonas ludipueritiae]|nr:hypothetical protein [Pseudoroseomonas ludipueritiae]
MAVQLDVKTTYADGSAKMAVVSLARPDLAAGARVDVVLSEAAAPAGGAAVDLAAALSAHSMTVDMTGSGAHASIDVMAALQQALKDGSASFWQEGPLATQARVEVPLEGSQRLVFDVTAFKGGGLEVEAQFNNDGAMGAAGGRVNSVVTVTLDGERVAHEVLNQGQYQNWHQTFSTTDHDGGQGLGDASSGWLNIRQDIAHLQDTGAIADYDLSLTLNDSLLQSYADATAAAGWGEPL